MVAHREAASLAERLLATPSPPQQVPAGALTLHADHRAVDPGRCALRPRRAGHRRSRRGGGGRIRRPSRAVRPQATNPAPATPGGVDQPARRPNGDASAISRVTLARKVYPRGLGGAMCARTSPSWAPVETFRAWASGSGPLQRLDAEIGRAHV